MAITKCWNFRYHLILPWACLYQAHEVPVHYVPPMIQLSFLFFPFFQTPNNIKAHKGLKKNTLSSLFFSFFVVVVEWNPFPRSPPHWPREGGRGCLMSPPCLESQCCHLIPLFYLLLFFCLVLLLFLSYLLFFLPAGPFFWTFSIKFFNIFC